MLKRLLITLGILLGAVLPVHAAGLFPLSNAQQLDANGKIIPGARLFLFDGGTSTPRIGYRDLALTTPHPNPILADAAGRLPLIFLADGYYRQRLTTKTGTMIFDQDGIPVLTTSAGGAGTTVDPDSVFKTGDYKLAYTDQPVSGFVRANGRSIGSAASGATERANVDTQALYEHLWPFANISVSGGKGASAAADFAANKALALPDFAGRGVFGSDDLGAGARGVLTSTYCGGSTLPGSPCGAQNLSVAPDNLPAYTLTGGSGSVSASGTTSSVNLDHTHTGSGTVSGTTSGQSVTHTHGFNEAANKAQGAAFGADFTAWTGNTVVPTLGASADHTHTYSAGYSFTTSAMSAGAVHNHTVTVTGSASSISISSGGSGTTMNKLPPLMTLMILMRL